MSSPYPKSQLFGEDELIDWLRKIPQTGGMLGDDAAILPPGGPWAVTMDSQVSGAHFFKDLPADQIARRLLAVNLSDIAAMGGIPAFAFLALSVVPELDRRKFLLAFTEGCKEHGLILAGGDLSHNENSTLTLTLLGQLPKGATWLRRDAAQPGQSLWVGGTLGEAALGLGLLQRGAKIDQNRITLPEAWTLSEPLRQAAERAVKRHTLPTPQLSLGQWLAQSHPYATIDISDGLGRDLHRLCRESRVGAEISWDQLPVTEHFFSLCQAFDLPKEDLVLSGGEDYVLLFTLPTGITVPEELGAHRIGLINQSNEITIRSGQKTRSLSSSGWDHFITCQK